MRIAMRVIAGLTLLCIVLGLICLYVSGSTGGDISPFQFYGVGLIALGLLCAAITTVLGIIASAMGRQFAWLVAIIIVAFLPLIGIPVVEILAAGQVDPAMANLLTGTVFGALILGGPALVALVVVIYSFRLRLLTA